MKQRGYRNWLRIDPKLKKFQTWDAKCPIPYIMISLTLFTFKKNFITGEAYLTGVCLCRSVANYIFK